MQETKWTDLVSMDMCPIRGNTVYVGTPANSLRIPENGVHVWPEEDGKRAGSRQVENSWTPESRGDIQEEIVLPRGVEGHCQVYTLG